MSGYWIYHGFKHVKRSKILDVPTPGRWTRFWMWLLMGGATWHDRSKSEPKGDK